MAEPKQTTCGFCRGSGKVPVPDSKDDLVIELEDDDDLPPIPPISKTYFGHYDPMVPKLENLADVKNELERIWAQMENYHKNDKVLLDLMNRLLEQEGR